MNVKLYTLFVCYTDVVPVTDVNSFDNTASNYTLCVPHTSINLYRQNEYWSKFRSIVSIPTEINLNAGETPMNVGLSRQVEISLLPNDAFCNSFVWTSSDESIATVSTSGVVTAIKEGTVKITATIDDGTNISGSCILEVDNGQVITGDINGDNKISISDAIALISYLNGQTPSQFIKSAADINDDSTIDIKDIQAITNLILNK